MTIFQALSYLKLDFSSGYFLIVSDSMSALQSISSTPNLCKDSLALSIIALVHSLHSFCINFIWIPGHTGIVNNEIAGHYAKEACISSIKSKLLPISELFSLIRQSTLDDWNQTYPTAFKSPSSHFLSVQPQLPPYTWYNHFSDIRRSLIIELSLLRFGHNRLPPHLKRTNVASSDNCPLHPDSPAQGNLNHLFFHYPSLRYQQKLYFTVIAVGLPTPLTATDLLFFLQLSNLSPLSRFFF